MDTNIISLKDKHQKIAIQYLMNKNYSYNLL